MKKVTDTSKNPHIDWLFGGNPNAIYAQEAQGQKELVASSQLPKKLIYHEDRQLTCSQFYERIGISVLPDNTDDIFFTVQLPAGWCLSPTDHSMWNSLIDNKGRKRASIFYKAAFYDRNSHIMPECRYQCRSEWSTEDRDLSLQIIMDTGTGEELYRTNYGEKGKWGDDVQKEAATWLVNHFPDYKDCFAYWD